MNVADLWVTRAISIRAALVQLDATGAGILLQVGDDGELLRTVTDGDLRRLLLAGAELDDALTALPSGTPVTGSIGIAHQEALQLLNQHGIDHLPLLDADGKVLDLLLRRDISEQIYLSSPHISIYEREYVEEAFRSNWIAPLGPNVDAFEQELAAHVGVGHAAAVSSGTAAIHLGLQLLGVGKGDLVFCSSLTFVATANPILYLGAEPVFIDAEAASWNMSPAALRRAFEWAQKTGRKPAAVVVVNLYGQSADMDPLLALCEQFDVPVLEDAAESLGATYKGKSSGTLGRVGIYSFNGNKIITTSGGGMLVSNDGELVAKARFLSTQAKDPAAWYQHSQMGYNYRMSNVLAGIGRGQLRVLKDRVDARRAVFERYQAAFNGVAGVEWMPEADFGRPTRWLTTGLFAGEAGQLDDILSAIAKEKIELRRVWKPMHQQPLFSGCQYFSHTEEESISDIIFARGVCLPSGSNMTAAQQERVISAIRCNLINV